MGIGPAAFAKVLIGAFTAMSRRGACVQKSDGVPQFVGGSGKARISCLGIAKPHSHNPAAFHAAEAVVDEAEPIN